MAKTTTLAARWELSWVLTAGAEVPAGRLDGADGSANPAPRDDGILVGLFTGPPEGAERVLLRFCSAALLNLRWPLSPDAQSRQPVLIALTEGGPNSVRVTVSPSMFSSVQICHSTYLSQAQD